MANDGGPAFPVMHSIDGNWNREPVAGLTGQSLLEYYAGQAMAAVFDHPISGKEQSWYQRVAVQCFDMAEAMVAEAAKRKS